jgi:hypothetical protein
LYTVVHQPTRTAANNREMFAQRIHRFARVFEQRQIRVILELGSGAEGIRPPDLHRAESILWRFADKIQSKDEYPDR